MQALDAKLIARIDFDSITPAEVRTFSAAILTRDTQYIRTADENADQAALAPTWGSWIEGQPLIAAVLSNRAVVVDLDPLSPEAFAVQYGCSVGQFVAIVKWFMKNNKDIFINLRMLDPDRPETFRNYSKEVDSIGIILQELEDNRLFYCLAVRRHALFALSDGARPHDPQRLRRESAWSASFVAEHYPRLLAAIDSMSDGAARAQLIANTTVRGGVLVAPVQLAWRIAYYRAYRSIFDTPDENVLDRLLAEDKPTPAQISEVARLATLYHHRYTAPITGAFGGIYNMRMAEFGPMIGQIAYEGREAVHGSETFRAMSDAETRIWKQVATERLGVDGDEFVNLDDLEKRPGVNKGVEMRRRQQPIDDMTIDYVLNQGKVVTDSILAYREELLRQLRSSILGSSRLRKEYGIADAEGWEMIEQTDQGSLVQELERSVESAKGIFGPLKNRVAFTVAKNFSVTAAKQADVATLGIAITGIGSAIEDAAGELLGDEAKLALQKGAGKTYPRTQILSVLTRIRGLQNAGRAPERRV